MRGYSHHRRRRRLWQRDRDANIIFYIAKRKLTGLATIISTMSILMIFLSAFTILSVPHVHSLSLHTPAVTNAFTSVGALATRPARMVPSSSLSRTKSQIPTATSLLMAASSPPTRSGRSRRSSNNKSNNNKINNQNPSNSPAAESRWQRAVRIEQRTHFALEYLQQCVNVQNSTNEDTKSDPQLSRTGKNTVIIRRRKKGVLSFVPSALTSTEISSNPQQLQQQTPNAIIFPDIRECNSALAAFGDGGDLLRALRLYFKMRKATQLALGALSSKGIDETPIVPTPTLVTYSTLMSRAVSLGKPQVALRLWKVMRDQTDFFSYASYYPGASTIPTTDNNKASNVSNGPKIKASDLKDLIVPDVKSANILMNTYAKLGDIDAAEDLMKQMQTKPVLSQQQQQISSASVVFGGGIDVPYLNPNLVTYNTLLDACQKTGEIDKALHWKSVLESESTTITYKNGKSRSFRLRPDARTYTILIGTVANKGSASDSYGTHDPSLAFQLLEEMKTKHKIAPNPLTYSALIDVCGRCKRSDLALKALRLMLRDERMRKQMSTSVNAKSEFDPSLQQQTVGAWTAAINACGKTGRIDTALKLFFVSMPRFKVKPNVITCSCLLDSLLKQSKTADSLEVLRYMKTNNLSPSEYIYSSFMNCANRLAGIEQNKQDRYSRRNNQNLDYFIGDANRPWPSLSDSYNVDLESNNSSDDTKETSGGETPYGIGNEGDQTKAVDVYSELMSTLIATTARKTQMWTPSPSNSTTSTGTKDKGHTHVSTNNELYQVTMVFREMKAGGVIPDLGSYNSLLRSCANSGDIDRAHEFLQEILDPGNDLEPNDRTWRAVLKTAGKAKRSDMVLQTWKSAVADMGGDSNQEENIAVNGEKSSKKPNKRKSNKLSLQTFRTLLTALLICAWDLRESDRHSSIELYKIIIKCYNALRTNKSVEEDETSVELYMGMHLVDSGLAMDNPQVLASVLQAVVNLEFLLDADDAWKGKLKQLGASIAGTKCLSNIDGYERSPSSSLSFFDKRALKTAKSW